LGVSPKAVNGAVPAHVKREDELMQRIAALEAKLK